MLFTETRDVRVIRFVRAGDAHHAFERAERPRHDRARGSMHFRTFRNAFSNRPPRSPRSALRHATDGRLRADDARPPRSARACLPRRPRRGAPMRGPRVAARRAPPRDGVPRPRCGLVVVARRPGGGASRARHLPPRRATTPRPPGWRARVPRRGRRAGGRGGASPRDPQARRLLRVRRGAPDGLTPVSGYVPPAEYATKAHHRQLDGMMLCARCSDLSHGRMVNAVAGQGGARLQTGLITPAQLREQLTASATKKALVVKVVDATDFHGSFLNKVRDVVGATPSCSCSRRWTCCRGTEPRRACVSGPRTKR